ncbi:MAG: hypothetical protein JWM85_2271 [Acidimicrobiaceae bacterium]|jgi:hypothetical protein|nr:hypothetical protein [Acidimicrobiaceae bacterium]
MTPHRRNCIPSVHGHETGDRLRRVATRGRGRIPRPPITARCSPEGRSRDESEISANAAQGGSPDDSRLARRKLRSTSRPIRTTRTGLVSSESSSTKHSTSSVITPGAFGSSAPPPLRCLPRWSISSTIRPGPSCTRAYFPVTRRSSGDLTAPRTSLCPDGNPDSSVGTVDLCGSEVIEQDAEHGVGVVSVPDQRVRVHRGRMIDGDSA